MLCQTDPLPKMGLKLASSHRKYASMAGVSPAETFTGTMRYWEDVPELKKKLLTHTGDLQGSTNQRREQTQVSCRTEHFH